MANIEDKLIDEFMESPEPLVPRVDKHLGEKRWGQGVPMIDEDEREALHEQLEFEGMVNPVADAFNAMLYATEGDVKSTLFSAAMIVPGVDYLKKAAKFTKKVLDPVLTHISQGKTSGGMHILNQKIDILGNTGNYIKPRKIFTDGKEYIVKTTDDSVSLGSRDAVVVEITNMQTGKKIYQPFYKSTGTGAKWINSKDNWLPFEGIVPRNMKNPLEIYEGEGKIWKMKGPYEGMWKKWNPKESQVPLDVTSHEGWIVKAFKNSDEKLVSSSIQGHGPKDKRGLPVHEEIDFYLRDIWNK